MMRRNKGYIGQAWLVLLLAAGFGAALATVHIFWQPKIAENKRNEAYEQIPKLVVGADKDSVEKLTVADRTVYKACDADGKHLGWVVRTKGDGFADKIEVLIGLDAAAETITGLYVLAQKETPGLGNKIEPKYPWAGQFGGKNAGEPLVWVTRPAQKDTNEIRAITGATVSSKSVCIIVNEALKAVREQLKGEAK